MKILVWAAALLVGLSIVYPNGITLPNGNTPVVAPEAPVETDATIVTLLKDATPEDKGRVVSIYEGMQFVLSRDKGQRINTTEKWREFQANTLQLAVEQVGKYPGLDAAIEGVFKNVLGTDDVLPATPETQQKLLKACEIIANSAKAKN
jgi:hypothetical protein